MPVWGLIVPVWAQIAGLGVRVPVWGQIAGLGVRAPFVASVSAQVKESF